MSLEPMISTGAHPGPVSQFGSRFVKEVSDGIAIANATLAARAIKQICLRIAMVDKRRPREVQVIENKGFLTGQGLSSATKRNERMCDGYPRLNHGTRDSFIDSPKCATDLFRG